MLLAAAALAFLVAYVAALTDQVCCSFGAFESAIKDALDTYYHQPWYTNVAYFGIWLGAFAICLMVVGDPLVRTLRAVVVWVSSAR